MEHLREGIEVVKKVSIFKAPKCISEDGMHVLEDAEAPFYKECTACFERFLLVSETVVKNSGLDVLERKPEGE